MRRRFEAPHLPTGARPFSAHLPTIGLAVAALLLFAVNVFFPTFAAKSRVMVTDVFSPLMNVFAGPADAAREGSQSWKEWLDMRVENRRLLDENTRLKTLIPLAQQYEAENKTLRGLMKYKDDSTLSFLTARVIGEAGGTFANSAVVTAGSRDGVKKDMIALGEDGVVGRVIEVGEWSSRILLLQDLSFRLPVQIEENQVRAILSGEGDEPLQLLYVPKDIELKPGMRVVSSGHGGIFPGYLPVGVVSEVRPGYIAVKPFSQIDRLHMVRLALYDLAGGAANAMNAAPNQQTPLTQAPPMPAVMQQPAPAALQTAPVKAP